MNLDDVLGDWTSGDNYRIRIERDAVHLTRDGSPGPMSLTNATVSGEPRCVTFTGDVSGQLGHVSIRRGEAAKLELSWDDGIGPSGSFLLSRVRSAGEAERPVTPPAVVRAYACGDNRVLYTAERCKRLLEKYGGMIADRTRSGFRVPGLDMADDENVGLVAYRYWARPTYSNRAREQYFVKLLNGVWAAIADAMYTARDSMPAGHGTAFDRAWCKLENPAPYMLDMSDADEADHIEYVDLANVVRQIGHRELGKRLLRLTSLPKVQYIALEKNALVNEQLADVPFDTLGSLEALNLSGNALTKMPESLATNTSIQRLSLAGNPLEEAPVIAEMTSLKWLYLSGTGLSTDAMDELRRQRRFIKLDR
ncbi:MAG: hypothetical protein DRJ42_08145 [Deltaproteobacteria bacterium]|nr:MAG: hypothetical protein DRJ42_08145 [Deltaproteobacteria bacterium]